MTQSSTAAPDATRATPPAAELLGEPWAVGRADGTPFSKDPSVVRLGERYLMYFTLPPEQPGARRGWHVGIAESPDLRSWTLVGRLHPAGGHESRGLAAPGAIVLDGVVHLFYQSYGNGPRDAICHAWSADGVSFTRNDSNPVFRPTGAWNCGRAIDADVMVDGARLLLAYATRDPQMGVQMVGVAEAALDSGFGADAWRDLSVDAPALAPELPWELECIEAPALVRRGNRLVMFYAGGYNNEPQQIGYAVSEDGVHWTRGASEPFLPNGRPGTWNSSESGHPGVFTDADGRTYLFFQGNDSGGRTNYLAATEILWDEDRPRLGPPE
ncbi:family 43 glycosylhydrolase [Ruania halotolerans]|uniref:family 43 glycosylhydrolase n=1 Tax=Ruania halotolerans TaxID=2897773 RepID=UPI001E500559|nr:family 43 glycosylhydrolase [Ruania halotolerans]UFU06749.1 family 43 glycosylhydrolase [Ruania halotolerans]